MTHRYFMQTDRLGNRQAIIEDAAFIHALWTMPAVMRLVGFPKGLSISVGEIEKGIASSSHSEFGSLLIVTQLGTGDQVGQCKMGTPDNEGICEPDIKLHPTYWGHGYGKELWAAMIDYAFLNSSASIVQGTPNQANMASIKMQRGSGMIQVDKGVFPRHPGPHPGAVPVPYFKLQITREQWQSRRDRQKELPS
jgi:RimJ/RimL family protein N-acetyltransferase